MAISFGDRVRVKTTKDTESVGVAGLVGQVYGETTPSITSVEVVGALDSDFAINVHFETIDQAYWFAPQLLEFIDHAPGTEIRLDGNDRKWTRAVDGQWIEEPLARSSRPWWRFW